MNDDISPPVDPACTCDSCRHRRLIASAMEHVDRSRRLIAETERNIVRLHRAMQATAVLREVRETQTVDTCTPSANSLT